MAEARIPVDLWNPGQVFACLGFMETAVALLGEARGGFDWSNNAEVVFQIVVPGKVCPVRAAIDFLRHAQVVSVAPLGSPLTTDNWGVPTRQLAITEHDFPFPIPRSLATLPGLLEAGDHRIALQHWGEDRRKIGRDEVKFWAGMQGKPGVKLAVEALEVIRRLPIDRLLTDPFTTPTELGSSFRFDWRGGYIPLDIGFSLNNHKGKMRTVGYPLVEMLAVIGLANARPKFISDLRYQYGVAASGGEQEGLDIVFLRAALGTASLPFDHRVFQMDLGWPGKVGDARSITTVEEITKRDRIPSNPS